VERVAEAAPPAAGGTAQLLADVEAAMAEQRIAQRRLMRRCDELERSLEELQATRAFRIRERTRRLLASVRR
jgi:hypothetical protein